MALLSRMAAVGWMTAWAVATSAFAGTLQTVTADKNPLNPGGLVTLTVTATGPKCGVRVAFGDGTSATIRVR